MKDNIVARGDLLIQLHRDGALVHEEEQKNLVVNTGLAYIAGRIAAAGAAVISHMGLGTSNAAAAAAQTALTTELARVVITSITNVTTTVTNDSVRVIATFPAGVCTGTINEAGLFNAASAGTMVSRSVLAGIPKGASDALTITWTIRFM